MCTTVGQPDHYPWIEDQFRNPFFCGIEQLIGVLQLQIIFDRQIEKSIKAVFATFFGDLGYGFPDQRPHCRVADLVDHCPIPSTGEHLRNFHLFAERRPESRITVELLLLFHRPLERRVPTWQIGENKGIA